MSIIWNNNTGVFGKTIQTTLYNYESEGLGLIYPNKITSKERKIMTKPQIETPSGKRKIIDVEAWMNTGGKGFFVKIEGKEYITSIESVQALLNGEKQGVKLGLLEGE